jgi:hypothetical protein
MIDDSIVILGFKKQKNKAGDNYVRYINNGYDGVIPLIDQYGTLYYIYLVFQLRIDEISTILVNVNNIGNEYKSEYPTLGFGLISLMGADDNRIKVETPNELENALNTLKNILENEAMHFFEKIQSVADLDKEMNRNNRPKDLFCHEIDRPFVGLISAVLNNNPQKNYWEEYYRDKLKNVNQYVKNQYERLVEYLKQNYDL